MEVASNPNYLKRAVVKHAFRLWKNGQVPYRFDGSLGAEHSIEFHNYSVHLKCSAPHRIE